MKANFLAKGKWYIFGIIAVVIILSIGLSFCTWDSASIQARMNSSTANYVNPPKWVSKAVGEDFVDDNGLRWLIVNKEKNNDYTEMVIMTYYVTEQRVYEATITSPDYNSPKNNIRTYLNDIWYPQIDENIRALAVPKLTAYLPHTVFPEWGAYPAITTLAPSTYNMAWLASENEVGLMVRSWGSAPEYIHDSKFQYFPENDATLVPQNYGNNPKRIAYTKDGTPVHWWTRTGKLPNTASTVSIDGGMIPNQEVTAQNNWLRPCVQIRFK